MTADGAVRLAPGTDPAAGPGRLGRSFAWLWASAGSATFADGIYQVALPVAALQIGGGPLAVSVVYTAARLPWAVVALHAGVLVDRYDRRRLLIAANVVRTIMLAAGAVVVTGGVGGVGALAVIAFVLGVAETVGDTAMHSLTPRVVRKRDIERANSRMQSTELLTNLLIGPSVGGLLAGIALGVAFGAVAVLYVGAALTAVKLVTRPVAGSSPPGRATVVDGLRFLFARRTLAVYAIGVGLVNASYAAFQTTLPVIALAPGPLGLDPAGYGLLIGTAGVTGLAVGLAAPTLMRTLGDRATLLVGQTALGIGIALPAIADDRALVVAGVAGTGFLVLGSVITVSYRQRVVPDHLLGRVTAAYRLMAFGGLPLGSAAAGVVSVVASPQAVLVGAGLLVLGSGAAMAAVTPSTPRKDQP